jgi:ketosteroid isomerase-like protein
MTNLINGFAPVEFISTLFNDMFLTPTETAAETVERYTHVGYRQITDGIPISRDEQIGHLEYARTNLRGFTFEVQQVVFDGEWLVCRHLGHTEQADGRGVDSEVVTFFHLVDGKISESYEMTRPVSGNDADRDVHTAR